MNIIQDTCVRLFIFITITAVDSMHSFIHFHFRYFSNVVQYPLKLPLPLHPNRRADLFHIITHIPRLPLLRRVNVRRTPSCASLRVQTRSHPRLRSGSESIVAVFREGHPDRRGALRGFGVQDGFGGGAGSEEGQERQFAFFLGRLGMRLSGGVGYASVQPDRWRSRGIKRRGIR